MKAQDLMSDLDKLANPADAQFLQRYFKTGKGEYGEGDIFLGLRVPMTRKVCKKYDQLSLSEVEKLLLSPIHEHRLAAVIILTNRARSKKCSEKDKKQMFDLYLKRINRMNNWDIIDLSCRDVIGGYLINKDHELLYRLARSKIMWERRIAIISTARFLAINQLDDIFKISTILINDKEDLIHKASGWMLREAGKIDAKRLCDFLDKYYKIMPRTMLRYSIEKMPEELRQSYLKS